MQTVHTTAGFAAVGTYTELNQTSVHKNYELGIEGNFISRA